MVVSSPRNQRRALAAFVIVVMIVWLPAQGVECFTQRPFAYFVIGSLLLWTFIEGFAHHRELSVIERDLREGTDLVKGTADEAAFYDRYEELRTDLATRPSIQHAWQEFSEEVFPDDPTRRMRNATQPSAHFTLETLAHGRVNLRWYGSFPNLLVGVGIIGTFLGLAAGIKIASPALTGSVADQTAGLQGMLGGAFVAFSKSAAGLLLSVCFTLYERRRANMVDKVIREFTESLEERLVLTTPQHLAFEQLRELREQTAILKKFNTALAPAIAEAAPALADALNSRIGERLEPLLERLHEVLVAIKIGCSPTLTANGVCEAINAFEASLRERRPEVRWLFVEPDIPRSPSEPPASA